MNRPRHGATTHHLWQPSSWSTHPSHRQADHEGSVAIRPCKSVPAPSRCRRTPVAPSPRRLPMRSHQRPTPVKMPGDHHRAVGQPIRASRRNGLRQGGMTCHCQCVYGPDEPCRSGYPQTAARAPSGVWQPAASPGAPIPVRRRTPVMRRFRHPVDQIEERGTACRRPRGRDCPRRRGPASPPPASRAGA